ncbi:death-associated protein 1 homolog [Takifugu rubripes]|uniref:Death-associated protein 1 n=2 Tax=Takifugu TaxID=31032 RepID=A0A5C6NU84_9TELE|nr:death-associated protein 1 [Takifugu rubripes]XP_056868772.1 death-associated protein 1 [Takifugu flavidus]TNM96234.1 hypothetical protein fugu_015895 [Takifugu bimaculatus]TWW71062.1 Death-associated protein 1 [Takifugu flavidus]|eukprot:XP_003967949.1 PREDICTED: death-associated protein 1 [Takifugu rubripes]
MSSPPKDKVETKGGHAPAVKAGGMRIVQKHQPTAAPEPPQKDDDEEEYVASSPPKIPVVVSGVVTKGDKDFTPAAAQVAHQKPQPGVPKHAPIQHIKPQIHQPRK